MSNQQRGVHYAATAIGITAAVSVAACGSAPSGPATSSSPVTATATSSTSATASTSAAPAAPTSGVSDAQTYTVIPSSSTGATADGHATWTLKVDTISGGDPKVADTFNKAVQDSAQQQLDSAKRSAAPEATWNFETTPQIYFSNAAVCRRR